MKKSVEQRPSARQRGYDHAWQKLRAKFLRAHPWCDFCAQLGQRVLAVEVDHIVRIRDGGKRLDPANLRALCATHHRSRSGRQAHGLPERHGCGIDGMPLAPDHPWRR